MKITSRYALFALLAFWLMPGCFPEQEQQCSQAVAGTACNPDDPGAVYRVNECGEFLDTLSTCSPGEVCGPNPLIPSGMTCVEDPDSCEGDDYTACNPDDPSAIYTYNKCDEVVGVDKQCEGSDFCVEEGHRVFCDRDPNDCTHARDYTDCNPDDPDAIYTFDGCDEIVGIDRQCDANEICEKVGSFVSCVDDPDDCNNDSDYTACNPDDPDAVYTFDGCGEVIELERQCDDHEICDKVGSLVSCFDDPDDCENGFATAGCNPDDLTAVYRLDGCGEPIEIIRNCDDGDLCGERNGRSECLQDCSNQQAEASCNRADPLSIYWKDSCGDFSGIKESCDAANYEVCDDSSGTPQCVRDCGSSYAQKYCVDGDYDRVYYANECGELTGPAQACLDIYDKVCGGTPGQATCVDGCGDPQTEVTCTSSDRGSLYWADRCGNITTKKEDCDAANFESCKTVAGVAQCVRSCGSSFAHRVCDPTQPLGRFYANECGDITQQFWTCNAANFEVCDDSSGSAKCVQDCGTNQMVQQVCDPSRPSSIYWADQCGNPTTEAMVCPDLHECDASSGTPTCTLNCGGNTQDHTRCDPANPARIAWANQCDNIVGVAEYCSVSNNEVCDDSSGIPQCVRDCGSSQAEVVCNPADEGALYWANECGEVTTKFNDCDAGNFEVCDDSSGSASCVRDCGSAYAEKACNPADPDAIYYANACGEITSRLRQCYGAFEVCDDSSGTPECVEDCGLDTTGTVCNPADPDALYYTNACGDITTKFVDCDASNFEVCDDSSGSASCVRDCGSSFASRVCIPGDYDKVYYANECGDITSVAQSCLAIYNQVCSDASGQARCDEGCGDPQTGESCNPNDPGAIYWTDRCGEVTTKKADCDAANFEVCKTSGGAVQCVRDCGSSYAQRVCDPSDPGAIYYANECGEVTTRSQTCSAARFEECDDSSGEARCVPDCGSSMAQQVCDPNDRSAIYWGNLCGDVTTKMMDCPAMHSCDDSSGTPTCTLDCGNSREQKVCDPSDPTKIFWANLCGELTATYDYCRSSNFEVCDDSSGTPQCVRDCGNATAQTTCNPADLDAIYYANACGEVTTKLADCDASNFEVCDDSSGQALCVRDCGSRYASKACNPADVKSIYYANECGEVTQRYRGCDSLNFEVCDDSSGTATCVQDCGGAMSKQVCDPNDPGAIYWANNCGVVTSKKEDCPAMESCDASGGSIPTCTLDCGTDREQKVCDPANPTKLYWADACGKISGLASSCSTSNFEVCDDSSGMATCERYCGTDREQLVCDSSDPGKVYWANRCGDITSVAEACDAGNFEVCDDSSGDAMCARDCGSNSDHKVCDPSEPGKVFWANACDEITSEFSTCSVGKQCAESELGNIGCQCVLTENTGCFGTNQLYSPSGIAQVDSCGITRDEEVVEACINGEVCREIEGSPTCWSSVLDKTSEFYIRGCTLDLYLNAPTDLPMDCRCRRATSGTGMSLGEGIIQCWPIGTSWNRGHRYANGPHFYSVSTNRQAGGGVLDPATGKIYFGFNWSDGTYTEAGMIGVFDSATGNREVLSGLFKDPALGYQTYGSGHISARYNSNGGQLEATTLPYIQDVEMGADGYLYALSSDTATNVEITRVDKSTGERTLMWKREVPGISTLFGQCYGPRVDPSYSTGKSPVQYSRRAFALDPQGNYYLAFANGFDGMGVVKISHDGSTCTILSRNASTTPADAPDIGGGYQPQYSTLRGMLYRNDKLYAYASLGERLIEYDVLTGDRANYTEPGVLGTGSPVIGETTMWYDDARGLMMTAGGASPYRLVAIDPVTRNRQNMLQDINASQPLIPGAYPSGQGQPLKGALDNGNAVQWGAVVPDPNNPDMIYFVLIQGALVKYEMSTGNSYVMSL